VDDSRAARQRCGVCDTEDQSSETVTRSRNAVGAIAHGPGSSEVWCGVVEVRKQEGRKAGRKEGKCSRALTHLWVQRKVQC